MTTVSGGVDFFSLIPRASISGDLLALSDFYCPRANGPVLVSSPGIPSLLPGGPMSCLIFRLYNINLSLPKMLSQPLRLAWLQQQLTHSKIIADPNLRWLFALSPTPCHDGPHFTLWISFIWTYLVLFTINLIRGKYRFPNLNILFVDSCLVSVHATKLKKKQSHILPFSMFTAPFWKSRVTWHGFDWKVRFFTNKSVFEAINITCIQYFVIFEGLL